MTESLRQLVERLVYGSFFHRHGLPKPERTQWCGDSGWWQTATSYTGGSTPQVYCSGATRAAAHLMLAVEALEAEGREVPTELRAAATLLLAEGAACVGWRAP